MIIGICKDVFDKKRPIKFVLCKYLSVVSKLSRYAWVIYKMLSLLQFHRIYLDIVFMQRSSASAKIYLIKRSIKLLLCKYISVVSILSRYWLYLKC